MRRSRVILHFPFALVQGRLVMVSSLRNALSDKGLICQVDGDYITNILEQGSSSASMCEFELHIH